MSTPEQSSAEALSQPAASGLRALLSLPASVARPLARLRSAWQRWFLWVLLAALVLVLVGKAQSGLFDTARARITDWMAPMLEEVRAPIGGVERWFGSIGEIFSVYSENLRLKEENARLKQWRNTSVVLEGRVRHYEALLHAVPDQKFAAVLARAVEEGASGDGAGTDRDHHLRRRDRVVSLLQGEAHVFGDAAGDQEPVGVPGRRHHLDPESAQVPADRAEDVDVCLAGVAAARADLPQLERATEEPAQPGLEGCREPEILPRGYYQVLACAC